MKMGVTAVMLPELEFEEQVQLCVDLGVHYYQYRPRVIPESEGDAPWGNWGNHKFDLTPKRFLAEGADLTRALREAGMEPWGTVPALSVDAPDDELRMAFEAAAKAEAHSVRVAPPGYPGEPFDYLAMLGRVTESFARVIDELSAPLGIRVIIETHSHSFATSPALALNICREFPPSKIGVIFDMANFSREGEVAPTLAVSVLKDYIDCVHIGASRRIVSDIDEYGSRKVAHQMCTLSEGDLYVPDWIRAIAAAGIDPPLIIEDYTPNMPGAVRLAQSAQYLARVLDDLRT